MKEQYTEEIKLLKKGYSLRNIAKITGTSINTIRKCKGLIWFCFVIFFWYIWTCDKRSMTLWETEVANQTQENQRQTENLERYQNQVTIAKNDTEIIKN